MIMRFAPTPVAVVAGIVILSATVAGCDAIDRVDGCTAPPKESRLLDIYDRDPVTRVADNRVYSEPSGGIRQRSKACRRTEPELDDSTITSVSVTYLPSRSYDAAALQADYDQVATGGGWIRVTREPQVLVDGFGRQHSTDEPGRIWLWYCARPLRTLSYLVVVADQPEGISSGLVSVEIRVAQPGDPACP
jgi:hypothetical protein